MKNIPMYEKITGLKRPLTMEDFISIARPLEVNNFPEVDVKFMTEVIYLAELGVYSVVTWDLNKINRHYYYLVTPYLEQSNVGGLRPCKISLVRLSP